MNEPLVNQRSISWRQILKSALLKWKYGNRLESDGPIRIIGNQPILKLPENSKLILGSKVVLNSDAKNSNTALTFSCTLVCGLIGTIKIGNNTMLNGVSITAYNCVTIGENCQIASCTMISDTDFHPLNAKQRELECMGYKIDHSIVNKKPVSIGNNVWIGWGCVILKGVTIGNNCIIGAGSVVLNDIPSDTLAAGNPAVVKKNFK